MRELIMHLKPAFYVKPFNLICLLSRIGEERDCLGNSKGYLAFEYVEPVCECASVPQLPVFPARPVRLENHKYANQVFAVLTSTVHRDRFTRFFVFHCT